MRKSVRGPLIPPERYGFFDRLLFAVLVLLIPPLLAAKPSLFGDGDVSWHVAAGQWILANGGVPDTDPFSYTMVGQPWVAHEWLAEIAHALVFDLAGYAGLAALVTAALMALHLTVFLHLRSRVGPVAILLAFVAMDVILIKFLWARPHILVWPLLAVWASLLLNCRDEERPPPLTLALLMLVWTNLHASFPLGFIVAGAIGFDALARANWSRPLLVGWLNFGLLGILAALLNLNGADGLLHPLAFLGLETIHLIQEWAPSTPVESLPFFVILVATLAVILLKGVRLELGETALLLLLLTMAFMQVRHQSWLVIIAALMLTPRLADPWRRQAPPTFASVRSRRVWVGAALVLAAASIVGRLLLVPVQPKESPGVPRRLLANIPAELRSQPLLNEYTFGGPLILARIRPYIDGRADMYGDAFLRNYFEIVHEGDVARFEQAVGKYGIRWTMLRHRNPLTKILDASPAWCRIYSDEVGVIHVRTK